MLHQITAQDSKARMGLANYISELKAPNQSGSQLRSKAIFVEHSRIDVLIVLWRLAVMRCLEKLW